MDIKSIAIAAALGVIGGAGISYLMLEARQTELDERLMKSPPIVVVDFAKMAMKYPEGATQEQIEMLMVQTNDAVVRLREAGYIVLDASGVVAAPEDVYLPEDLVQ
jgi:hypothetical protein